jgi:hypothetical protein
MLLGDTMRVRITATDDNGNIYEGTADLTKATTKLAKVKNVSKTTKSTAITGPADVIRNLFSQKYFKTEKTRLDVIKNLNDAGYNFDPATVSMALNRASFLRKNGPKGNYRFIQKYPPG